MVFDALKIWLCAVLFSAFLSPTPSIGGDKAGNGVEERSGQMLPLDTAFRDEAGSTVSLRDLIDKPTVISFAYFSCNDQCNTVQSNVASVLGRLDARPGRDYTALTISIDETDTPSSALHKKRNFIKAAGSAFPEGAWRFLTGGPESIRAVTGAAGFEFTKTAEGFNHPAVLMVVSPEGRINRYLYGAAYLPFDLKMAIIEASEGKALPSIKKAILFCYSYDPESRRYVFDILRVTGLGTLFFAGGLFVYLTAVRKSGRNNG